MLAGLPASTELVITEERDGTPPFAYSFTTGTEDVNLGTRLRLAPGFENIQAAQAGVSLDDTKSQVRIAVSPSGSLGGLPDATIAMSPASGDGPFYANTNNVFDPALTATTTSSVPTVFFNVEAGEVEVTAGPATLQCNSDVSQSPTWKSGWASSTPNSVRLAVIGGYFSSVRMYCE